MSTHSIAKILTSAIAVAGVLATTFAVTGAAQADDRYGHGQAHGGYQAPAPRHVAPPAYNSNGHGSQHRHHDGDKIGKAVAIGIGAAILGGILASEANRHRQYDRNYD